jgi:hypothetical protein
MKRLLFLIPIISIIFSCKGDSGVVNIDTSHKIVFLDSIQATVEINEDQVNSFFKNISMIDMSIQIKENCEDRNSCLKSYKNYLSKDVESFTEAEQLTLATAFKIAYDEISKVNPNLLPKEVQLIKTKGKHYGNSVFYTRENIIVIPENELLNLTSENKLSVIYHELFHIISRYNPNLKDELYSLIGFRKINKNLYIPEILKQRMLLNPDGIDMEYVMTLQDTLANRKLTAIPIIISSQKSFDKTKPAFFAYLKFDFYEIINNDKNEMEIVCDSEGYSTFSLRNAGDFYSQIQDNTGYIIHPDEIMADNFTMVFTMQGDASRSRLSEGGKKLLQDTEAVLTSFE